MPETTHSPLIGKPALKGTAWTVGGYAGEQVLRLASNLIVTRLLFPEAFGVVAIVWVAIQGLQMLSDVGIEPGVIRHEAGETASFLATAWTIQAGRGVVLWLFSLAAAHPLAAFYQEPLLGALIPVAGLTAVCDGLSSPALYTLNRRLKLAELTLLEITAQAFGLAVMNLWAWLHPTIWALVGGAVAARLLRALLSHMVLPRAGMRPGWRREYAADIFRFGRWIFLSSAMAFFSAQLDRLVLGRLLPLDVLGVYIIAWTLADVPRQVVQRTSSRVIFPVLAQQSRLSRGALRERIARPRGYILAALAVGLSVPTAFGDKIIAFLYDDRYIQAGWMLSLLSPGLWPVMLTLTVSPCLYVFARPHCEAAGHNLRFFFLLLGIPAGFALMGLPGAVLAIAGGYIPFYAAVALGLRREGLYYPLQDATSTLLFAGAVLSLLGLRLAWGWGSPLAGMLGA